MRVVSTPLVGLLLILLTAVAFYGGLAWLVFSGAVVLIPLSSRS